MSNTDRLRSGPGLPSSARLVDRAAGRRAPFTSPHPSLAHNGQWIRSDTRRYTLKGAASRDLNFILPTATAPSTSKSSQVPVKVLRHTLTPHRLQKASSPVGSAPHRAPPSVRTSLSAANIQQTQVPSGLVACSQHVNDSQKPTTKAKHNSYIPLHHSQSYSTAMSTPPTPPPPTGRPF